MDGKFVIHFMGDNQPTVYTKVAGYTSTDTALILQLMNGKVRIIPLTSIKYMDMPITALGDKANECFYPNMKHEEGKDE